MGVIKKYFKTQFRFQMFMLKDEDVSDFYLSAFQKNRSTVPLFFIRLIISFGCIGTLIASAMTITDFGYWPIFLTHWGLVLNAIAAVLGVIVSARAYLRGPIEAIFGLPWYVKMYWVMTNIATTIALFITVFYWSFLTDLDEDYAPNEILDVFIHLVNSILMLALLLSARQPMRLLHFYQPLVVGIIYMIFSIIYYFAGGTNPWTNDPYIYPPLDWSTPGTAVVTVLISMFLITILNAVCAALVVGRDTLGRCCRKDNEYPISIGNY
ncbi:unnamed protein product [Parnassius mnemosyne]|uniref:Protein rolling stone n=1 Tax=Parnassius mnemosyne TaxID=213953 RepID=A0AAV1M3L7_9NEOP